MALKKIKPRHREIMRRLLTNQNPEEIALELQVSEGYLGILRQDPLFIETMDGMEDEIHQVWLSKRAKTMDILEAHSPKAAQLCVDAIDGMVGTLSGELVEVPLAKRLESAWDVLDRTGFRAAEKKIVAHTTIQEMIIEAYKQRNNRQSSESSSITMIPEKVVQQLEQ